MGSETKLHTKFDNGGYSGDGVATATCFCGAVQLEFSTDPQAIENTFICNCTDCHKLSASAFCSNFVVDDKNIKWIRGKDKLTMWAQNKTIDTGNTMTDFFCSICGRLLNRVSSGFPGKNILRIGSVDDFNLQSTLLKPRFEQFTKDRLTWLSGGIGIDQHDGNFLK